MACRVCLTLSVSDSNDRIYLLESEPLSASTDHCGLISAITLSMLDQQLVSNQGNAESSCLIWVALLGSIDPDEPQTRQLLGLLCHLRGTR